jgi:ABC-type sugar transport system substrate-binding protein
LFRCKHTTSACADAWLSHSYVSLRYVTVWVSHLLFALAAAAAGCSLLPASFPFFPVIGAVVEAAAAEEQLQEQRRLQQQDQMQQQQQLLQQRRRRKAGTKS